MFVRHNSHLIQHSPMKHWESWFVILPRMYWVGLLGMLGWHEHLLTVIFLKYAHDALAWHVHSSNDNSKWICNYAWWNQMFVF
jgi:hypothetical protein